MKLCFLFHLLFPGVCFAAASNLNRGGLLDDDYSMLLVHHFVIDYKSETTINYLFQQSLSTVSALSFHYLQDLWRWKAFRGDYPDQATWNDEFWKLSEEIVGVHAPVERTPQDLDCPAIFHVAQDYDMIRYFARTILQFQFAESLCEAAGQDGPLHECDFFGSTSAGEKLA